MTPRRALTLVIGGFALMAAPTAAQRPERPPRVLPMQVVPRDTEWNLTTLRLNVQAIHDVRQWYRRALDGHTFRTDPIVVLQSRHTFAELAADDFQAWWPLLGAELADYGYDWRDGADFKLLFLVQGAGAWAGADSENGGIERVVDAGRMDRGDYGGMVVIGDSSAAGVEAGVCPMDGIAGGTAWWCNWDTYRGTIAHELGHTWGIPHPDAFNPSRPDGSPDPWDCSTDGNTVMQCHWGFPDDSLLTYEAEHFRSLRFFAEVEEPPYLLVTELLPTRREEDVAVRRLGIAPDRDRALLWVDDLEQGSAVGYPWGVGIGAGGAVAWSLPTPCGRFVAHVGRARASGGRGQVEILVDGDVRQVVEIAGGRPVEVALPFCNATTLGIRALGQRRFRAAIGNPRLYWEDRAEGAGR
jgi:hypothetical protein